MGRDASAVPPRTHAKILKHSRPRVLVQTQSVFSLGYGEDDDKEGDVLTVPLGSGRLVSAVDEASTLAVVPGGGGG